MMLEGMRILIVGLVRNVEPTLQVDIDRLRLVFADCGLLQWFVVESDSSDKTVEVLEALKTKDSNFNFISLGNLKDTYPLRTERIAFCRNEYVKTINTEKYNDIDYVVVADLDNINSLLSKKSVNSCWESSIKWDVCTANQDGPYYDVFALRHGLWNSCNFHEQMNFLRKYGLSGEKVVFFALYSKMITIPSDAEWIEVDSAFGGLAVYKKALFSDVSYVGVTEDEVEVCEHVSLHRQMKEKGANIYINPALINSGINEHSELAVYKFRVLRFIQVMINETINEIREKGFVNFMKKIFKRAR